MNTHPDFKQEINICRQHYHTFEEAITYRKTVVSRLFLEAPKTRPRRNISSVGTKEANGVDISDLTRWYDSYPMRSKSQAGDKLLSLIQQVGIPNELHRDGAEPPSSTEYVRSTG